MSGRPLLYKKEGLCGNRLGGEAMRTICCVCHRTKGSNGWKKQKAAGEIRISHGYCPDCYQQVIQQVYICGKALSARLTH